MTWQAPSVPAEGPWSVAVFARNEAERIGHCLRALARCEDAARLHVTVLLNGTTDGSAAIAASALREARLPGALYDIPHGDKSHAVNLFLHRLRPAAGLYLMMDGYVEIRPDAPRLLARRLARRPDALAAAAVPSTGRSAAALRRSMMEHPGLHGSLFALRGGFVERLARAGLRLPRGLYRGDGLLGSMVLHDLDALGGGWIGSRIAVEPGASWANPPSHLWRWRDLRRHGRRMMQQARGRLQNAALRSALYAGGFAGLPEDADRMLLDWIAADPAARAPRPWKDPLACLALARIRQSGPGPSPEGLEPRLLWAGA
ncbi:hypothetical protein EJV46_20175 [Roseococcus sp. SYP-B2431]|uniref:hypothetical protein n=1 Tax=Roseococcus sp. SYP-B2431 TaxID=2496640 RepID=UPI00103E9068|nr:hypothetical protein [Roseococcus sp. SYP-B2431]TCH96301.1 hypothetical protein EJV46_20175 [Roseococcus sp. SYP-B2431]